MDPDIVEKAKRGEPAALDRVLRAVTPGLSRLAMRLTCDTNLAEDLVLETLYRGALKIRKLREPGAVASWFSRVLVNLWRDQLRSRSRDIYLEDLPERTAGAGSDPVERLEVLEMIEEVASALARLPPIQRAVLALRIDEGLSVAEIAKVLRSTPDRVKASLWHARRRLKDLLGGALGELPIEEEV